MEKDRFNVMVNGMGNIGTTLVNLLVAYRELLKIENIYVLKRTVHPWNQVERDILAQKGVTICSTGSSSKALNYLDILPTVDYLFEATSNGVGLSNLETYKQLINLKGCSAQGSEKGFGIPFMSGVNDEVILGQKFVQIVSCNTHGSAALLRTFCGVNLENLDRADVVVVRRSEDLGNHERLVTANVVARHLDNTAGTHHSVDVIDLFKTNNIHCDLTSSDITTPSQLMHAVRFNIQLNKPLSHPVEWYLDQCPFMAKTLKFDSNVVFEIGRRYGFNGRIYAHAIVLTGNILKTEKQIKGWAFVPQEGNSILSTIHAFILQMKMENGTAIFEQIRNDLLLPEF